MCKTIKDIPDSYKKEEDKPKNKKHKAKLKPYKRSKYRDNQVSQYQSQKFIKMTKETNEKKAANTSLCAGVGDVEKSIDANSIYRKDLVEKAAEELAKDKDNIKKDAIYSLLKQGEYNRNLILLSLRRNRAVDDAYAKFLKAFAEVKDNNVVGGIMKDMYDGKLDEASYQKAFNKIREDFRKAKTDEDNRFAEYKNKLRNQFPGWTRTWEMENYHCDY